MFNTSFLSPPPEGKFMSYIITALSKFKQLIYIEFPSDPRYVLPLDAS